MPPGIDGSGRGQARSRLIITADDYGRDAVSTSAIAEHLAAGRITATSIMVNGACFGQACEVARARGIEGKIGMHLVFDEGLPVSNEMRAFADVNGNLCTSRSRVRFNPQLLAALEAECVAQVQRAISAGIRPTHLDSHRHVHTHFLVAYVVTRVARRFGIPYVRPARNLLEKRTLTNVTYKSLLNRFIAFRVGTADYFGDIEDFFQHRYAVSPGSLIECMVHLDGSPRGLSGQKLLQNAEFQAFVANYELVGHAPSASKTACHRR